MDERLGRMMEEQKDIARSKDEARAERSAREERKVRVGEQLVARAV